MPDGRIAARLRALLAYHSGTPEELLGPDSTPQNTGGWDSLANLNFMAAIEEEFEVTIALDDVMKMRSLGEIEAFVEANSGVRRTG